MSVTVRPATPDDATAIADLHALTHRATDAPVPYLDFVYEIDTAAR